MKVAIIGITGRIGKRVARELVSRGHEVFGGNRRTKRVAEVIGDLDIPTEQVDTSDYDSLIRFVQGKDAVFLATAPMREAPEAYPEHSRNVIRACKEAGVPRLVAMSNYKALRAPSGQDMLEADKPHPAFYKIEAVYDEEERVFREEHTLDWLLIAPAAETFPYGEKTGQFRVREDVLVVTDPDNNNFKETSKISMEDVAYFAADEIEHPESSQTLVSIAY